MGKSKKVRKHLSSSQAQFLGFDPKPRYKNGRKAQYSLSKKDLKKLALYDELDSKGKVMVYDIETSMVRFDAWGTGQQYVRHDMLVPGPEGETRVISVSWKFVGEDHVYDLTWDDGCDKELIRQFMMVYNRCDMVIGQNNNSFDNKIVRARAAKHGLFVNRFVKSFDIYRKAKIAFKLQSYSMKYMANYFGLTPKLSHEGIKMWKMIQYGTPEQKEEYLKKMVEYNVGDIVTTEELYMLLRPYLSGVTHIGVAQGKPKWVCPISASENVKLYNTIITPAGTVQRILWCEDSNYQFKVSNKVYRQFLERGSIEQ